MSEKPKHQVLIIGGGFGGVKAALDLCDDQRFKVTLVSSESELRYYPTLFHTATGGRRANSSIPYEVIFEGKNIDIVRGTAIKLDRKAKSITTSSGTSYTYDTLILALGVVTNYFNIPGLKEFSFSTKSQAEVERFKKHLHDQLINDHRPDLNYVVVGGGSSGIELAGALPYYLKQIMRHHRVKTRKVHIDLIEAAPKLLPHLPKDTSRMVERQLRHLGIKIYTSSAVDGESADALRVNGKPIMSHTVVWTAGDMNHPFFAANGFSLMSRGKVAVDIYLKAEDNIFVIGDNANTPYSGLAQTALVDGAFVAENLKRQLSSKDLKSYTAKKVITIIPAGPHWAAVIWGGLRIYGILGWMLREVADFIGFHDLEPWDKAASQWLSEFGSQDNCPVCAIAKNAEL